MKFYVINLDRSPQRWTETAEALSGLGIEAVRLSAVDGKTVPSNSWMPKFDSRKFRFCHGLDAVPGEYGCYASHLAAISAFLETSDETCVIFEDDVMPLKEMLPVVDHLNAHYASSAMLVRLVTHRIEFYESLTRLPEGRMLGQCWFGPSGSAAGYWITRRAAILLIDRLQPGYLPFDIAIERAWETGVANYVVNPNVCAIRGTGHSTINSTAPVNHRKPVWYQRLGAARFRTKALFARIYWCMCHRKLV